MSQVDKPPLLRVRLGAAAGKGRGIFAAVAFSAGDAITEDATVELSAADCDALEPTTAGDYYFAHPEDPDRGLLVFGPSSLANHSGTPNATTGFRRDPALGWILVLTAARAIAAGEEVTRLYACPPWFPEST